MSRNGRLKVYDNIYGDFCRQMRTPCVIFTGHPSLRIGDAVHFLEMWGNDSKNALIMTGNLCLSCHLPCYYHLSSGDFEHVV